MKFSRKLYGLDKLGSILEREIFLNKDYPELYATWIKYKILTRQLILRRLKKVIMRNILQGEFKLALAKDIIENGSVNTESNIYKFMKTRIYRGNLRLLLSDLQEELNKEC